MRAASWVIREIATKRVICETFNPKAVAALNTRRYEAVAIGTYLGSMNGLCPHGFVLADNVCGPCSEGRPNRKIT